MGIYKSAIITAAGINLVAESLTGEKTISFSTAKSSSYAYPEGTNFSELTDLQDVMQIVEPSSAQVINGNIVQTTVRFSNEKVENDYLIQTIGLYAKINDSDEILFSVLQAITPDQMPKQNPVSPTAYIYNIQTLVNQASQITVTVNPAGTATVQDIINLKKYIDGMRKVVIGPENTELENNTILLIVEDAPQEFDAVSYNNIILSDTPPDGNTENWADSSAGKRSANISDTGGMKVLAGKLTVGAQPESDTTFFAQIN